MGERYYNERMERIDRKELLELQNRRFRATVKHAYENVQYYKKAMDEKGVKPEDIKGVEDISKLPFTTKQTLRDNYPFGMMAVPKDEIVEIHATSGTTGQPTLGLYTVNDIEVWSEVSARSLTMSGLTKQDIFQITPSFGMFTGGFGFYHGARKIGAFIVPAGAGFSKRQIQYMIDFGTTMVCAVVSYILRLTETAHEMGIDPAKDTQVRKGVFGSEIWTEEMKKKISKAWEMDVYDIYGFTELCGPGVANDCKYHEGLHVWEDHFLIEVIDPKTGEQLGPEEEGELVFTTLTKEAMPLLRYRSRDLAKVIDSIECDCGRTHRRITPIRGRLDDMIKVRGVGVWPSAVEQTIMKYPEIGMEYQIQVTRKEALDYLKILVESKEKMDEFRKRELADKLSEELHNVLMIKPEVEVLDPMTLPRQEVGKAKRVIDNRQVQHT
ncbi:MAG TPA: phenylacetate--CoA ligase family protein [Candidatus Caldiarchaeum subterraneum]|uniref:Phenylacetate--CoA ligase family protein n=1 Tax=Caldiarchaeum subterraneum TaxID=311458 RepID=A0A832ZVX0_CALS0|nr:phenylacetate--CoA ligase family protein [Candidatus Caldarchaeum subterraneum]